ncbi:unnamed protein product [Peniophora sp. CBMAI 1063]|nr:unnamed protein product [Peniophora sp. CBMAI 1063]
MLRLPGIEAHNLQCISQRSLSVNGNNDSSRPGDARDNTSEVQDLSQGNARHVLCRLDGMPKLLPDERFCAMDYSILAAVQQLRSFCVLSYDVCCPAVYEKILPKFHTYAHKLHTYSRYDLASAPNGGVVDGEECERVWMSNLPVENLQEFRQVQDHTKRCRYIKAKL